MQSLLDVGSNGTIPSTTDSQMVASVRGVDRRSQEVDRIVGYIVNATCSGIFSFRVSYHSNALDCLRIQNDFRKHMVV